MEDICELCGLPVSSRAHKEGLNGIHERLEVAGGSGDQSDWQATGLSASPEPPATSKRRRRTVK